ncbi:MAG: DUF429 domain-containing protein [Armatimonadota bacterium]|nr:DUF429 domain-containing protein [Armatimonadota bacterium]
MKVVGADAARGGWLAVCLTDGKYAETSFFKAFGALLDAFPQAAVVAVDIPVGLPRGVRRADEEARKRLGSQARSVLPTPPRPALHERNFRKAYAIARALDGRLTKQSHALSARIVEVERYAVRNSRIVEVHPEVSFWAMNGQQPLAFPKRTWNGLMLRLDLLRKHGIELPSQISGTGPASAADVVDAAAAAWSAWRVARGEARCLPDPPPDRTSTDGGAIWY